MVKLQLTLKILNRYFNFILNSQPAYRNQNGGKLDKLYIIKYKFKLFNILIK